MQAKELGSKKSFYNSIHSRIYRAQSQEKTEQEKYASAYADYISTKIHVSENTSRYEEILEELKQYEQKIHELHVLIGKTDSESERLTLSATAMVYIDRYEKKIESFSPKISVENAKKELKNDALITLLMLILLLFFYFIHTNGRKKESKKEDRYKYFEKEDW